jgi:hypothetical protein
MAKVALARQASAIRSTRQAGDSALLLRQAFARDGLADPHRTGRRRADDGDGRRMF